RPATRPAAILFCVHSSPLGREGPPTGCPQITNEGGCVLLAQSGHHDGAQRCPLLGVKRTSRKPPIMSACRPFRWIGSPAGSARHWPMDPREQPGPFPDPKRTLVFVRCISGGTPVRKFKRYKSRQQRCRIELSDNGFNVREAPRERM